MLNRSVHKARDASTSAYAANGSHLPSLSATAAILPSTRTTTADHLSTTTAIFSPTDGPIAQFAILPFIEATNSSHLGSLVLILAAWWPPWPQLTQQQPSWPHNQTLAILVAWHYPDPNQSSTAATLVPSCSLSTQPMPTILASSLVAILASPYITQPTYKAPQKN